MLKNNRHPLLYIVLTIPIILYGFPLIMTGGLLAPGDADYLMQTVEAARKSIFEYGQFPWWNPWISGGVPLFANPQFGLISLPTLFGIIFGATVGYKIALIAYLVIGFWGFYLLFTKCFQTPKITAALLGYIWSFSSFFAQRGGGGHYTFFTIVFLPLLLLFFLKRKTIRYSWLWLGLVLGFMINSAAHNTTVMTLAVFGIFVLIELLKITYRFTKRHLVRLTAEVDTTDLRWLLGAGGIATIVAGPRLLYTMEYIREYPRNLVSFPEDSVGVVKGLFAMFGPVRQYYDMPTIPNWSWMEVSAYIGALTALVAVICLFAFLKEGSLTHAKVGKISPLLIIILGVIFFSFGLGMIVGDMSPYNILRHLPVFSEMRVASRWIVWASIMTIIFIALYTSRRYRGLINFLLLVSTVELFFFGSTFLARPYTIAPANYTKTSSINQQVHFDIKRSGAVYDENLTATTSANIGQVIAGDALIDTRNAPPIGANTIRCDSDEAACRFVMTGNAVVESWSPNRIALKRTGPGVIRLNMNPGKYWLVNNEYIFTTMRLAEPDKDFAISSEKERVVIQLQPKYSLGWVVWKLARVF